MIGNKVDRGLEFSPAQRTALTETTIRLGAARLESIYSPTRMLNIVRESGFSRELLGLHMTLTQNGSEDRIKRAEKFARQTVVWSLRDLKRRGVEASPEIADLAKGVLGTERI